MTYSSANTSVIRSLWEWWLTPPPGDTPAERRFDAIGVFTNAAGWLGHFSYIFLFAYWGVWPLAIFNIFSVILWTVAIIFWRQGRRYLMFAVQASEMILHAALIVHYLGWESGGQYYLIDLMLIGFLLPWPRWIHYSLTAMNTILFVLCYYYTRSFPTLYAVPDVQLAAFNIFNIAYAFAIAAGITLYFVAIVNRTEAALADEHAKSEALLNNVLPTPIATRLKQDSSTIADGFSSASVLFADIAGFTHLSQQISPQKLVDMLDAIFSHFDELVDQYGLEKIKTMGDNYMVASGIPTPREDHAEALALFALAMRETLADYNRVANTNFKVRIGLNSGPVVAGVIGKRRFIYDLWGDTVNTASRMESHGEPGQIQVSRATRQLLDDRFNFMDRGIIDVKGKGPMQTYFLKSVDGLA